MSAISWTETLPSSTSTGGDVERDFLSMLTSVSKGLSTSFAWPGTGGGSLASAGVSQLGNARCARAGNSATTGGFGNGFLLLNQNHLSLHHIGSTWTGLLGHSSMVDHGSVGSAPFASRWLVQSGSTTTGVIAFGSVSFTFPVPYGAAPFVHISAQSGGPLTPNYVLNLSSVTTGGFSAIFSGLAAGPISTGFVWESEGTVSR